MRLATRIAAARLRARPSWAVRDPAERMSDQVDLADGERSVPTALALSYEDLDPEHRRLFRRLGLHPGTDLEVGAAAALYGAGRQAGAGAVRNGVDREAQARAARYGVGREAGVAEGRYGIDGQVDATGAKDSIDRQVGVAGAVDGAGRQVPPARRPARRGRRPGGPGLHRLPTGPA